MFCGNSGSVQTVDILTDISNNKLWTPTEKVYEDLMYKWEVSVSDFSVEPDGILGDVDGDSEVSIMDATAIQMHMASLKKLTDQQKKVADTDKDGEVSIMDATAIQLFVAKIIHEF